MSIKLIAAIGKNRELGKNNSMMWDLPGDMRFFRTTTQGSAVIMGRKTYESIGRPLPKRENIVISRNVGLKIEGVKVVSSLKDAISAARGDAFIIGGASVYAAAIPIADELILTEIDMEYPGADVFFPEFDSELYERRTIADGKDGEIKYTHASYVRKR